MALMTLADIRCVFIHARVAFPRGKASDSTSTKAAWRYEVGQSGKHSLQSLHTSACDLRKEADLLSDSPVDESNGVLLLDLGTVADAETAMNAEGGLLLELVLVRSVLRASSCSCGESGA